MATDNRTYSELLSEIETLRLRLEEAEDTLQAIHSGEVDALVISRPEGEQVFTLQGAEHPYRVLVETMSEGAVFLTSDGHVVYANKQLANLLQVPIEKLISSPLVDYVAHQDQALFTNLLKFTNQLKKININSNRSEITFTTGTGNKLPAILSFSVIDLIDNPGVGVVVTDISERKKAEDVSKASYQYARSLLEASLDPLMTISVDGKIMDVNQATITVTGIERDQLIGTDVFAYFTEPDLAELGLKKVFSQGSVTDYPLAFRHVSGKVTDVLYNASIYRNPQGEIAGVFAAARDITGRKLIEQQLETSLYYTRSLIEASLDLMVTLNVKGKIIAINKVAEQLTELPRAQLVDSDFALYFIEPEQLLAAHQEALTHGGVVEVPLTIKQKSGAFVEVLYNASPYRNQSGEIEGLLGVARNVTERNKTEQKLRLAASVFDHAWEGILITTPDGTIMNVNEAFNRITSYSRHEVLGKNPNILSSGRQDKDFYANLWHSLKEQGHWVGEVWNRRKNGEVYAVMENISVVLDSQGKTSHYIEFTQKLRSQEFK